MAPIKFENDFKEKLDKRTIAPSNEAWNKLSERLDAEESQSNNKGFWWIGIAASIIGILFAIFQFSKNDIEPNIPVIGENPEKIEEIESKPNMEQNIEVLELETVVATEDLDEEKKKEEEKNIIIKQKTNLNSNQRPTQIANQQTSPKVNSEKDVLTPKQLDPISFEKEKAQEVADAIFTLSETTSGVTDASIDSLLKVAQRDILLSRMKNEDRALVDAALLLQEVEFELDESFREKVFKAFKSSYGSVKTAIAQRND